MNNTLTDIIAKVLATGMQGLRSQVLMTRVVNLDYSAEAAKRGQTIDVPISQAQTATDVVPGPTPPAGPDLTAQTVPIQLNNWKKSNFGLTDQDLARIMAKEHFIPLQMGEAFQAIAASINQSVFSTYKGVYGFTGTPGTTPFATNVKDATNARKVLNGQRAGKGARRAILDFDAEANALSLSAFSDAEKTGSANEKIEGEIGRKFGMDWMADEDVPTHATTGAGVVVVNQANHAIGDTSVTWDGGGTQPAEGDVFTVAGVSQTFVVESATATTITYAPEAPAAFADNAVITFKADHVVNLAFHRDAFALAMRAPDTGLKEIYVPENSVTLADPLSGLVMRLEIIREYKQVLWELDAMWGTALVRAASATRIAG